MQCTLLSDVEIKVMDYDVSVLHSVYKEIKLLNALMDFVDTWADFRF